MLKLIKLMTQSAFEKSAAVSIASVKIQKFTKETLRFTEELYFFAPMGEMARYVSAVSNSGKTAQVLDIGYDTGRSTVWLMLATGVEVVHAVDVTRKHAPSLKQLIHEVNPKASVQPVQASVSFLPYRENMFDAVFCRSVLQYVEMEKAIFEIRRVLKPHGTGYVIANMADNPFVNLYRRGTIKQRSIPFGHIRGYVSYRMLRNWEREGWCVTHKEYHLFAPLLFPVLNRIQSALVKQSLLFIAVLVDTVIKKAFPFLNRFAWLAFFEIRK